MGLWAGRPSAGAAVAIRPDPFGCLSGEESADLVFEKDAEQLPLGGGDDHVWRVGLIHALDESLERLVGSDGARAGLHDVYYEMVGVDVEAVSPYSADSHPVAIEDHANVPSGINHAGPNLSDGIVRLAGRDVRSHGIDDRLFRIGRAFCGKPGCFPVGYAVDIVVDPVKSERFEPARGSWRHVSQPVVAVGDYRSFRVEDGY